MRLLSPVSALISNKAFPDAPEKLNTQKLLLLRIQNLFGGRIDQYFLLNKQILTVA